jgi:hypothetical protein
VKIRGYLIATGITLLILAGLFFAGYRYYSIRNPCPGPVTETVYIHDTVIHRIVDTVPYYIVRRDSVIRWREVPADVDTMQILDDFYACHYYTRTWEDSLLRATSEDVIAENQFVDNRFTYQILRPQTVINNTVDNSVNYSKYLYLGMSATYPELKYADLSLSYAFSGGYLGVGYYPFIKTVSLKWGVNLHKFK